MSTEPLRPGGQQILAVLSGEHQDIPALARLTGQTEAQTGIELVYLELAGRACRLPGNVYIKKEKP